MGICGIATKEQTIATSELRAMSLSEAGYVSKQSYLGPRVGMSYTSATASAELWSSDQLVVCCDVELSGESENKGQSSAERIARLYLDDGPLFISKLRGAFSLAIWDHETGTLMLAVDRFGIKRLCYGQFGSRIVFATQPRSIFASARIEKKVDLSAITEYFVYNVVPIPRTAFEGVNRVSPGEYVLWTDAGITKKSYWDMRYPEDDGRSARALSQELLGRMESAVRECSGGLDLTRTGCFLSGGTDSSSIVGLLTSLYTPPIHAFSIGFSEDRFDELEYARLAARHFRARHVEGKLTPEAALGVVEKIISAYDEPFGNSSAIPTYWCAKLAREHGMDVLLAGDGGDELFGGNERYREEQIFGFYRRLPEAVRRYLIEPAVWGKFQPVAFRKVRNYIDWAKTANPDRYCRWRLLQRFSPASILQNEMPFRNGHSDLLTTIRSHYRAAAASSELNRLLYADVKMTLGDDDLPKVTQTAELAGVRVRFPYLDHELAEFSGRLPSPMKVRLLEKRYLFKRATRSLLPAAILKKKKHGFGLPIGFWLKSNPRWRAWSREVLLDPRTYQRGYFRRDFVEQLFTHMESDDTPYYGDLLWPFLALELWHRQHVEVSTCCA